MVLAQHDSYYNHAISKFFCEMARIILISFKKNNLLFVKTYLFYNRNPSNVVFFLSGCVSHNKNASQGDVSALCCCLYSNSRC